MKRILALFLAMTAVAALGGCAKKSGDSSTADKTDSTVSAPAEMGEMHINVEHKEISLQDLKAADYTVPLLISLEKNGGISYSEWGLKIDRTCTFEAQNRGEGLDFKMYFSENPEKHFLWTAWASGTEADDSTGGILILNLKLPANAQPGDSFTVEYADWSLADKGHIWKSDKNDWVAEDSVTWTDGGVTVID